MYETSNDLLPTTRRSIVEILNEHLADAIDLQLQAKQAHWNVKGPNFVGLHELFDRVASQARDTPTRSPREPSRSVESHEEPFKWFRGNLSSMSILSRLVTGVLTWGRYGMRWRRSAKGHAKRLMMQQH